MSNSLQPHGLQPTRLLCPWDFPGKNTGVSCHFLFQGTFLTQGSNPGLLPCRQILYCLSQSASPQITQGTTKINSDPNSVSSVQLLSRVWLCVTPAHQASLSIANSWGLLKLMSIESVMPSNRLILCHPLLHLPLVFPSIRVFSSESALCISWPKY